jgi:hypothetical protein
VFEWIDQHRALLVWAGIGSVVLFVGTLALLPMLIARLPADFFSRKGPPPESWRGHHPVLRMILIVAKNVVGYLVIAAGIAMLFLPGQGILTIVMGIGLLDFPGKRKLLLRVVSIPAVWRALQWTRRRTGHPEFERVEMTRPNY